MKTKIVKIGNSRGVRIPKLILEQAGIGEEVEIEAEDGRIIINPATYPRQGWNEAFKNMSENADDKLLDEDLTGQEDWDRKEWEW